jgi:ubiquinone/menaquinone biosynthesis C-methylase UbiE
LVRRLRFSAKGLEEVRRHSWRDEYKELLYAALRLKPDQLIVDVGCGTGAFSRILAEKLDWKWGGRIIGIDRDSKLLAAARRLASASGLSPRLEFMEGDAKNIQLPDEYADRVVCQALLWLMTENDRANVLKEMIRICKRGGLVAAVEGSIDTSVGWFPDDPRLTELYAKSTSAMLKGYKKVYGYDRSIGYKIPSLFKELGLSQVRLDGITDARLRSDDRFPSDHSRGVLKLWYLQYPKQLLSKVDKIAGERGKKAFIEKNERVLTAGGMAWKEIIELNRLKVAYYSRVTSQRAMGKDATVEAGIHFVTTGIKA